MASNTVKIAVFAADTQGQGENHCRRERRTPAQRTKRITKVLPGVFQRPQALLISTGLGGRVEGAKPESCLATRLIERQSRAGVFLGQERQVFRQLLPHAVVLSSSEHRGGQPSYESSQGLHAKSSALTATTASVPC